VRRLFWQFAHRKYHRRKLSFLAELAVLSWASLFCVIYGGAFLKGWRPDGIEAVVTILLTIVPLLWVALHWRIRVEAAKGDDALYRKLVAVSRQA